MLGNLLLLMLSLLSAVLKILAKIRNTSFISTNFAQINLKKKLCLIAEILKKTLTMYLVMY